MKFLVLLAVLGVGPFDQLGTDQPKFGQLPEPSPSFSQLGDSDEKKIAAYGPNDVIVYLDLSCEPCVRLFKEESSQVEGIVWHLRDQRKIPGNESNWKFFPVLYVYSSISSTKWRGRAGWFGPAEFVKWYYSINPDQSDPDQPAGSRPGQQRSVVSQNGSGGPAGGYPVHAVDWHLTSEPETRESLIRHLSTPRSEHHGWSYPAEWLRQRSFAELKTIHDDFHKGQKQR